MPRWAVHLNTFSPSVALRSPFFRLMQLDLRVRGVCVWLLVSELSSRTGALLSDASFLSSPWVPDTRVCIVPESWDARLRKV